MVTAETREKFFVDFEQHNIEEFANAYAEDVVLFDPGYTAPLRGRAAVRKDFEDFLTAFPDIKNKVDNVVMEGNKIAYEVRLTGTHKGPFITPEGAIEATGRSIEFQVGAFSEIGPDGLVVSERRYYDMAGLMRQLGRE